MDLRRRSKNRVVEAMARRTGRTSPAPQQTKLPALGWQTWSSASAA
jgi:hypothetical protein